MKLVLSVSKKHNSIWRVYGYDYNEDDNLVFHQRHEEKDYSFFEFDTWHVHWCSFFNYSNHQTRLNNKDI